MPNVDSSPLAPKAAIMTQFVLAASIIASLKAGGYSDVEINDLQSDVRGFEQAVLPRKKEREAEAENILRESRGRYTREILEEVFDIVDKGPIGPVRGAWFGETLSPHNRTNLYALYSQPTANLNALIDELCESGDLGYLGEWRRAGNRGMRTGAATLFMYLYSPDRYNVWLPKTHGGLSRLRRLGDEFPKGGSELSPDEYRVLYRAFNEHAIAVREENGFAPQIMDWFLFAVDEVKSNPANPGLRALIEGRMTP